MESFSLKDFVGGWFIGDFEPTLYRNSHFEVSVKRYQVGSSEPTHFQLLSTEYTVVVSGRCRLGDVEFGPDDIIRIPPLEAAGFEALTDVVLVAIKTPSAPSDKVVGVPQ